MCTEEISFHRSLRSRKECRQTPPAKQGAERSHTKELRWAASDGASSFPDNTDPLCTTVRKKLKHEQDSKSMQPLQSLAQPTAFRISKCNFIHGLKFCFLIWFVNGARQELPSCVYQVASAARNPDLFGTLGRSKSLKKEEESTKITVFQCDPRA